MDDIVRQVPSYQLDQEILDGKCFLYVFASDI